MLALNITRKDYRNICIFRQVKIAEQMRFETTLLSGLQIYMIR
jgi:hypothetical protein